ncbi:MAG: serine/threonine protein phosphatase [Myxococcales bacterium]|nr:serine/threonine protein phosphatase [Myxococcales bacterium]
MSTATPPTGVRVAGDTNVGKVRTSNEDSMIVDAARGLYVVLDGMGGANAGDIASQTARDAILSFVAHKRTTMEPTSLMEAAIQSGSAAVFGAAQAHKERHGMGTTVVACLVVDAKRAVVAHVGDSRAYLLRQGRLQTLTRDHTIVEELVDRGLLSPDEAERHPYKNVLSRNLGSRAETRVDVLEIELKPGDRVLLCSDGLYGYASAEGIQYILGSGDAPEHVARDLIELALRGGGGDNVTTIVIEAPQPVATTTQLVKTSGAVAWWQHRQRFLHVAKERGIARNPIVRGLEPNEALELVGLSLCQAIFHDLEKSTGVNVWTFAQNLAGGWFERGGEWAPLRGMMDILGESSRVVVDEIRTSDSELGFLLDVAVSRALVVAELALGGLLAERLRQVDSDLIELHTAQQTAIEASSSDSLEDTGERWIDRPTIPFMRPDRPVTNPGESAEVMSALEKTLTIARARTAPRAELVKQVLTSLEAIVADSAGNFAASVLTARELYGVRTVDDAGIMPLFDALDHARILTASSVHQIQATDAVRARVLRVISAAHQRLVGASTGLVLEAAAPHSDKLREAQAVTSELRDQVAKAERKRADLERRFATNADPSLPWGSRGTTEW